MTALDLTVKIEFHYRDDLQTLKKAAEVFCIPNASFGGNYEVYGSYGRHEAAKELQIVIDRIQTDLWSFYNEGVTMSVAAAQLWLEKIEVGTKGAGCSNFNAYEVGKTIENTVLLAWLQKFVITALVAGRN
jgi:hypothetical protein